MGDGGDGGDDEDGDAALSSPNGAVDHEATVQSASTNTSQKKKKKKSKKKKTSGPKQSSPPRVPLSDLFPTGNYPMGEIQSYTPVENTARTTAKEDRLKLRTHLDDPSLLDNYRKAAEIHRQVRLYTQETVRPGQTLTEIALGIEDGVRALLDNPGLEKGSCLISGLGFPTGLALNHCVAHYTPNVGQKEIVLHSKDVMKVDFGVHIDGWIVDSAFTMSFDPTYDNLLAAVKESTNTGIKVWASSQRLFIKHCMNLSLTGIRLLGLMFASAISVLPFKR